MSGTRCASTSCGCWVGRCRATSSRRCAAMAPRSTACATGSRPASSLEAIPHQERVGRNFDHPDAFDNDLLKRHVSELLAGHPVEQPIYDYAEHRRLSETRHIGEHLVIVLEGILIFVDPELRALMDIKLFIDADPDVRFIRRLRRDLVERGRSVDSIIRQYEESVRPMHLQFVDPTKRYADLIIPEGGHNRVAIDLVKTKIRELLRERGVETVPAR